MKSRMIALALAVCLALTCALAEAPDEPEEVENDLLYDEVPEVTCELADTDDAADDDTALTIDECPPIDEGVAISEQDEAPAAAAGDGSHADDGAPVQEGDAPDETGAQMPADVEQDRGDDRPFDDAEQDFSDDRPSDGAEPESDEDPILFEADDGDQPPAEGSSDPDPVGPALAFRTDVIRIGLGEKLPLADYMTDVPTLAGLVWSSSKSGTVSVSADSIAKGRRKGKAVITVSDGNGATATCTVQVVKAPKKISLNAKRVTLGYDDGSDGRPMAAMRFQLKPKLSKGSASRITYSGYDKTIIDVSPEGLVTPLKTGRTTVTAKTFNKKKATCTVSVIPAPNEIGLNRGTVTIGVDQSFALKAVLPKGTAASMTWSEDGSGHVTVDGSGRIKGIAPGEAVVTATAVNGVTATCDVCVCERPQVMSNVPGSLVIGVKEKDVKLAPTFDSGTLDGACSFRVIKGKRYAKVSGSGVVTGVKKGKAKIRITSYNRIVKDVSVTVRKAPKSVSIGARQLVIEQGEGWQLKPTCPKGQGSAFRFSSSDDTVATVDDSGLVSGVSVGSASIEVYTFNGKKDTCEVKVVAPAASISMPESASLVTSLYEDFEIQITDVTGEAYAGVPVVTFSPSGIASYKAGRLRGIKAGQGQMTVRAGNVTATCDLDVVSYRSLHPVKSIAHRGASGYYPENTLAAFAHAAEHGADGIELDVHTTKDGIQIVNHNATVAVKKNNKEYEYPITEYTYAELKEKKPSLCTLDEALDVVAASGCDLHLEMKDSADGAKCVELVKQHGMEDRTVYFSFYDPQLRQVYGADPTAFLGKSLSYSPKDAETQRLKDDLHLSFLVAYRKTTTRANVDAWHGMGLKVCIWTVNDRKEAKKFSDMGVDFILSNYPNYVADAR